MDYPKIIIKKCSNFHENALKNDSSKSIGDRPPSEEQALSSINCLVSFDEDESELVVCDERDSLTTVIVKDPQPSRFSQDHWILTGNSQKKMSTPKEGFIDVSCINCRKDSEFSVDALMFSDKSIKNRSTDLQRETEAIQKIIDQTGPNGVVVLPNREFQVFCLSVSSSVVLQGQPNTLVEVLDTIEIRSPRKAGSERNGVEFRDIKFKSIFSREKPSILSMEEKKEQSRVLQDSFMFIVDSQTNLKFESCHFEFERKNCSKQGEVLAEIIDEPLHQGVAWVKEIEGISEMQTVLEHHNNLKGFEREGELVIKGSSFKNVPKPIMVSVSGFSLRVSGCIFQNSEHGAIFLKEPRFLSVNDSIFYQCGSHAVRVQVYKGFDEFYDQFRNFQGISQKTEGNSITQSKNSSRPIQNEEQSSEFSHTLVYKKLNFNKSFKSVLLIEKNSFKEIEGNGLAIVSDADPLNPLKVSIKIDGNQFEGTQASSILITGICSSHLVVSSNKFALSKKDGLEVRNVCKNLFVSPMRITGNLFYHHQRSGLYLFDSQVISSDNFYDENNNGVIIRSAEFNPGSSGLDTPTCLFEHEKIKKCSTGFLLNGILSFATSIRSSFFEENTHGIEICQEIPLKNLPGSHIILYLNKCTFENDVLAPICIQEVQKLIQIQDINVKNKSNMLIYLDKKELMDYVTVLQERVSCMGRKKARKINGLVSGPWGSKNLADLKTNNKKKEVSFRINKI